MTHSYRAVLAMFALSLFVSSSAITAFAQTGDIDPNGAAPQSCITVPMNIRYRDTDATTGGAVSMVQEFLIAKGYMQSEATGYFGSITFASVKKYQAVKGFTTSGYVGPLTRGAIKEDSCSTDSNAGQNPNQNTTTNTTNTNTNTNTTNTTSAPTNQASGAISSTGGATGCTVALGATTCPVTVQWSSLNYAGSPAPYLAACPRDNYSGTCASPSAQYAGASGSRLFNIYAGTSWLFTLWGTNYLGQLFKTDQLTLKATCITGYQSTQAGNPCVSSTGATGSNQFIIGGSTSGNTTTTTTTNTTTTNSSGQSVGVSNSPTGPFVLTATNAGKIYTRTTGLIKANNPKGCSSPAGLTGCLTVSSTTYRDFTATEWGTSTTSVITITNGGTFPNGNYDTYISYSGQAAVKWGTFGIWTIDPATYTGVVFGAGGEGIPGNQPVTYAWYVWTGPYTLWQWAGNLGYPQPTVACTVSNVGATYYLGKGNDNRDIVATCYASNQQMSAEFTPVTSSTLNQPGATTTTATTTTTSGCTYTRGTFADGGQTIEWANGGVTCTTPPSDATGWVSQSAGVWHRVVSSSSTTTTNTTASCSYTTGSFTEGSNTTNWACGSATCTGAPAGSGWADQGNGCYHQTVTTTADTSEGGSGYGSGNYEQP